MPPLDRGKRPAHVLAEWAQDGPGRFAELMHLVLKGDARTAQLAATPMTIAIEAAPDLATPWLTRMLALLDAPAHPTVYRSVMRSLQFAPLPEHLHARILDKMLAWINDPTRDIAPRAFAISVALRIVEWHPPLASELKAHLEVLERTSPGPALRVRLRKGSRQLAMQLRDPAHYLLS